MKSVCHKMTWWLMVVAAILAVFMPGWVESRQKCWACQYQRNSGAAGRECVDSPGNWTAAGPRIRCPGLCVIDTRYDAAGDLSFIARNCLREGDHVNRCVKSSNGAQCLFTCEGENYCNGRSMSMHYNYDEDGEPNGATTLFTFEWTNFSMRAIIIAILVSSHFRA